MTLNPVETGNSLLKTTKSIGFTLGIGVAVLAVPANAYQVDCAILLCLSGGWPAAAPCVHARAVFMRRITPWPIEPPLQIWRCPMRIAINFGPGTSPSEQFYKFAFVDEPLQSHSRSLPSVMGLELTLPAASRRGENLRAVSAKFLHLAQQVSVANGAADINISGSEFDFVRSIRVWNVMQYSHQEQGSEGECEEQSNITLGTYGVQGDFSWAPADVGSVPSWVLPSKSCYPATVVRTIGVAWKDYEGNQGYEIIPY
jgi:hypothetical protein